MTAPLTPTPARQEWRAPLRGAAAWLRGCLLWLAASGAPLHAQALDEAAIQQRAAAAKFDELKGLEAASARGDPVAMYWWGSLIGHCIYGPCAPQAERALVRKSALAGYSAARVSLMRNAESAAELDAVIADIGAPRTTQEQSTYVLMLATFNVPGAVAQLEQLTRATAAEGSLFPLLTKVSLEGSKNQEPLLRALVEAGTDKALAMLVRHQLVYLRVPKEQLVERALAGDRLLALALCGDWRARTESAVLPPALLPRCEQAAREGYPAALDALIAHHVATGKLQSARYFADLCERLYATHCAESAADAYQALATATPTVDLILQADYWNRLAGNTEQTQEQPVPLARRLYAIRVRNASLLRACNASKYAAASGRFEISAECPWRKPVRIDERYMGAS